ncbi:hypothetical protein HDU96_008065 [Phlyctochytrium bullatum]|nr:hypothetical protein HDU96_008065 [Phlyctochytrium bullatum]
MSTARRDVNEPPAATTTTTTTTSSGEDPNAPKPRRRRQPFVLAPMRNNLTSHLRISPIQQSCCACLSLRLGTAVITTLGAIIAVSWIVNALLFIDPSRNHPRKDDPTFQTLVKAQVAVQAVFLAFHCYGCWAVSVEQVKPVSIYSMFYWGHIIPNGASTAFYYFAAYDASESVGGSVSRSFNKTTYVASSVVFALIFQIYFAIVVHSYLIDLRDWPDRFAATYIPTNVVIVTDGYAYPPSSTATYVYAGQPVARPPPAYQNPDLPVYTPPAPGATVPGVAAAPEPKPDAGPVYTAQPFEVAGAGAAPGTGTASGANVQALAGRNV